MVYLQAITNENIYFESIFFQLLDNIGFNFKDRINSF